MQIFSFSPFGYEGALVTVEVDLRRGIPAVDIVGLADGAVRESRERMRSAIKNSNFDFPSERVLVSLSPADLKKEGAGFDLAIALAVLKAHYSESSGTESDDLHKPSFDALPSVLVVGELELSGNVREVRAVHAAVSTAYASGILYCIVPKSCEREAREVKGMKVFASDTLSSAFYALFHEELFVEGDAALEKSFVPEGCEEVGGLLFPTNGSEYEFSVVKNQGAIVRALEIGAAGGHNIIAVGSPGSGKTLAFQKFPSLLPLLSVEDAYPVTRIYSIAGLLSKNVPLVRVPPFRMPHQTASMEGICGGGTHCLPGEISLAHNGVLFLDEAAEFKSSVLQMLRVPLEQQSITLARAGRTSVYPASFQLLMATNPCPCGNFGSKAKMCLCSARSIELYWRKFSGPLLDRIDIRVSVQDAEHENVAHENAKSENVAHERENVDGSDFFATGKSTRQLREEIARAILFAQKRQGKKNAKIMAQELDTLCPMSDDAKKYFEESASCGEFSGRARSSVIKVSRTIADMEESETIERKHVAEAVFFRKSLNEYLGESCR